VGNADMLNCYYAHADEAEDVRLQVYRPRPPPITATSPAMLPAA